MKLDNNAIFFEELVSKGIDATTTAWLLLEGLVQLRRNKVETEKISDEMIESVLSALKRNDFSKEILLKVLEAWSKQPEKKLPEIVASLGISRASEEETRLIIKKIVEKNLDLVKQKKLGAISALMGDAMKELRGKASGEQVNKLLKEEIEKVS
jgi:glutamyl-tRNA(Gln) amidotransferase subunit E